MARDLPKEPSEEVQREQDEDFTEGEFLADLDKVTRRLAPAAPRRGRGSPRRSGPDRHDG